MERRKEDNDQKNMVETKTVKIKAEKIKEPITIITMSFAHFGFFHIDDIFRFRLFTQDECGEERGVKETKFFFLSSGGRHK